MEQRVKVVYDDGCPTCRVGIDIAEELDDKTMEFIGMNTNEGRLLISEHGLDMEQSAYVLRDGRIAAKADFMREVFGTSIVGKLITLPFRIPFIGNALYDLLALHRKHVTKTKLD